MQRGRQGGEQQQQQRRSGQRGRERPRTSLVSLITLPLPLPLRGIWRRLEETEAGSAPKNILHPIANTPARRESKLPPPPRALFVMISLPIRSVRRQMVGLAREPMWD